MSTVTDPTNQERGEAGEAFVRKRLGGHIVVASCPQHGPMKAKSSQARVTYYYCRYCSYSKKVTRPS